MGSSICSKFRKWRKNFESKKGKDERENIILNVDEETTKDENPATNKLREIIRQEDDELKVVPYTTLELEELIVDLEKQLQEL